MPGGVNRHADAMLRHALREGIGIRSADSGMLHAARLARNALARLDRIVHAGKESWLRAAWRSRSQAARLPVKMLPSGAMAISVSRLPAGTTVIRALENGSAEPQTAQKLRAWRVPGS